MVTAFSRELNGTVETCSFACAAVPAVIGAGNGAAQFDSQPKCQRTLAFVIFLSIEGTLTLSALGEEL